MKTEGTQKIEQMVAEKSDPELLAMLAQPGAWQSDMLEAAKLQLQQHGFEFSAPTAQQTNDREFDDLQRAAERTVMGKDLRVRGIGSIVWGLISIGLGLAALDASSLNLILVAMGVLLVIEGIWVVAAPSPSGLILDGIALLALGIWNLAVTIVGMSSSSGNDSMPIFLVIGSVQIAWGCQSIGKYLHFSKTPGTRPPLEILQRLDEIADHMKDANSASDPRLIEFVSQNPTVLWKGQLWRTGAVFLSQQRRKPARNPQHAGRDLLFIDKQDVLFRNIGEGVKPGTLKVAFAIKKRKLSGVMTQDAFQRYEGWKIEIKNRPAAD